MVLMELGKGVILCRRDTLTVRFRARQPLISMAALDEAETRGRNAIGYSEQLSLPKRG